MKKIVFISLCLILSSCINEPKKIERGEFSKTVSDTSSIDNNFNNERENKLNKYLYIVIEAEIPSIYNGENYKFSSKHAYTKEESTVYFCSLSKKDTVFISEIIETEDFNEQKQNDLILSFENKVKKELVELDKWLLEVKLRDCKNLSDLETIKAVGVKSKIINKEIFDYDSYTEANKSNNNERRKTN